MVKKLYPCPKCNRVLKTSQGRESHFNYFHKVEKAADLAYRQQRVKSRVEKHNILDGRCHVISSSKELQVLKLYLGTPCDSEGNYLPENTPPPPLQEQDKDNWSSFGSRIRFELAEELYQNNEASASSIDRILNLWAAHSALSGHEAPFKDFKDVYL